MANEPKTVKFQMMLSKSEARAIDDWGFANRIRSRAEAIRRLCAASLAAMPVNPVAKPLRSPTKAASRPLPVPFEAPQKPDPPNTLIPRPKVRKRYGISEMTMWRWENNPSVEFPSPIVINRRKFYRVDELSVWEAKRSVE